jgi:hypothetical protein
MTAEAPVEARAEPAPVPEPLAPPPVAAAPTGLVLPDAPVVVVPAARPATGAVTAEAPAQRGATRYCPVCEARVTTAPDGLHCREGHRLSPAHGRRRGGWLRRRSH